MGQKARLLVLAFLWLVQGCATTSRSPLSMPDGGRRASLNVSGEQLPEENSLVSKITVDTPPQRAASLRLTEEGRRLLDSGDHAKALARLEQSLAVDSSNPYVYFYLAMAHLRLAQYRQSIEFLDVAESLLSSLAYWLGEIHSLKGENYQALGLLDRANTSYATALRFDPNNRRAALGLSRVQRELRGPAAH